MEENLVTETFLNPKDMMIASGLTDDAIRHLRTQGFIAPETSLKDGDDCVRWSLPSAWIARFYFTLNTRLTKIKSTRLLRELKRESQYKKFEVALWEKPFLVFCFREDGVYLLNFDLDHLEEFEAIKKFATSFTNIIQSKKMLLHLPQGDLVLHNAYTVNLARIQVEVEQRIKEIDKLYEEKMRERDAVRADGILRRAQKRGFK